MLQEQLEKSRQDLQRLQEIKQKALAFPEELLRGMHGTSDGTWLSQVPRRYRIMRFPHLDLSRWQQKLTRRSNTPYEQNCDYLVGKVVQLQHQTASAERIAPAEPSVAEQVHKRSFAHIRNRFIAALETNPFAPDTAGPAQEPSPDARAPLPPSPPPHPPPPLHQPKPKPATRSPFLDHAAASSPRGSSGLPTPVSMPSHSANASPLLKPEAPQYHAAKARIRRYAATTPEQTSLTHNVPWSDDEKRKLGYLMGVYPEEDIAARRFAKIAAALGTRTPNQVASRIQKLQAKLQKQHKPDAPTASLADDKSASLLHELEELFAQNPDPALKQTPEYEEYCRIKAQVLAIQQNPLNGVVHNGFSCDCCGTEPIIGPRWSCTTCPVQCASVDLCNHCISRCFETGAHSMSHVMKKIEIPESEDTTLL